jgi:hypothetical protein
MAVKYLVWVAAAAACSKTPAEMPADAAVDAIDCTAEAPSMPATISGSSPRGSLDIFHYVSVGHVDGFCTESYVLDFTTDGLAPSCTGGPTLYLYVLAPFQASGSNAGSATLVDGNPTSTDKVAFEATQLDPPDATTPHIIGHFVSNDPAWSFDIPVDLTSQYSKTCEP